MDQSISKKRRRPQQQCRTVRRDWWTSSPFAPPSSTRARARACFHMFFSALFMTSTTTIRFVSASFLSLFVLVVLAVGGGVSPIAEVQSPVDAARRPRPSCCRAAAPAKNNDDALWLPFSFPLFFSPPPCRSPTPALSLLQWLVHLGNFIWFKPYRRFQSRWLDVDVPRSEDWAVEIFEASSPAFLLGQADALHLTKPSRVWIGVAGISCHYGFPIRRI